MDTKTNRVGMRRISIPGLGNMYAALFDDSLTYNEVSDIIYNNQNFWTDKDPKLTHLDDKRAYFHRGRLTLILKEHAVEDLWPNQKKN